VFCNSASAWSTASGRSSRIKCSACSSVGTSDQISRYPPQGQIAKGAAASRSGTEVGSRFLSDLGSFSIAVSVEEYGMSASSNLRFSFEVVPGVPSPRNSRETALVIFRCDMRRLLNRDRKRV